MLQVPVTVSGTVGNFVFLQTEVYAERHHSSSALLAKDRGRVGSIQESIWVNKHRKFHLIPHIKIKTPARMLPLQSQLALPCAYA